MAIMRGKIRWTIPGAGTALSVLHFQTPSTAEPTQTDADAIVGRMAAFVNTVKSTLPNQVSLLVLNEVEQIRETDAGLLAVWAGPSQTAQNGTAAAAAGWAAAAGAVISWSTQGIRNSRRVRGRTFIVPLSNECWDVDGTLKSVPHGSLQTAATNLRTSASGIQFGILARETAPDANDGIFWPASGHRVPDMSAILRSRRS